MLKKPARIKTILKYINILLIFNFVYSTHEVQHKKNICLPLININKLELLHDVSGKLTLDF